jgi:hypothetical protein
MPRNVDKTLTREIGAVGDKVVGVLVGQVT